MVPVQWQLNMQWPQTKCREWDVLTGMGTHLTASSHQNADLFWALAGGSGGTYGVVSALTVKAYPDMCVSAANLAVSASDVDPDSFVEVIETFQSSFPAIVDTGAIATFFITNVSFSIIPVLGPGIARDRTPTLLDPTLAKLEEFGIKYGE